MTEVELLEQGEITERVEIVTHGAMWTVTELADAIDMKRDDLYSRWNRKARWKAPVLRVIAEACAGRGLWAGRTQDEIYDFLMLRTNALTSEVKRLALVGASGDSGSLSVGRRGIEPRTYWLVDAA